MNKVEDNLLDDWTADNDFFAAESTSGDSVTQSDKATADVHNALMKMGLFPVVGNMADITDAILYAAEGEFGEAGMSALASVPFLGQFATGQKILKKAKDAGEEIVTVYRGVNKWYPGKMVRDGKFVSGAKRIGPHFKPKEDMLAKDVLYTTTDKKAAESYAHNLLSGSGRKQVWGLDENSIVLEFQIPKKVFDKDVKDYMGGRSLEQVKDKGIAVFGGGLPEEYLVKVHKYGDKAK
jgi:hypothetical protein